MSYLPVTRTAGPAREDGKGAFSQPQANEHAAYMDTLAGRRLVIGALGSALDRLHSLTGLMDEATCCVSWRTA